MNRLESLLSHQKQQLLDLLQEASTSELQQYELQLMQSPTRDAFHEVAGRYPGSHRTPEEMTLKDFEETGFVKLAYEFFDHGDPVNRLDELIVSIGEEIWDALPLLPAEKQMELWKEYV